VSTKSFLLKSAALAALSLAVIGGNGLASSSTEAGHKHKHKKFGVHLMLDAPIVYGGYGYYGYHGSDGCYWLKKKAWATGSKYWWKRYHECKHGDDGDDD